MRKTNPMNLTICSEHIKNIKEQDIFTVLVRVLEMVFDDMQGVDSIGAEIHAHLISKFPMEMLFVKWYTLKNVLALEREKAPGLLEKHEKDKILGYVFKLKHELEHYDIFTDELESIFSKKAKNSCN